MAEPGDPGYCSPAARLLRGKRRAGARNPLIAVVGARAADEKRVIQIIGLAMITIGLVLVVSTGGLPSPDAYKTSAYAYADAKQPMTTRLALYIHRGVLWQSGSVIVIIGGGLLLVAKRMNGDSVFE